MEPVITAQIVKSFMDSLVIPILKDFASTYKLKWEAKKKPIERHFHDYFIRLYDQLSIVNTLALKNQQNLLLSIYQPLTISVDYSKRESERIDKVPYQLIDKYQKILITDTAGMGKSTMSKFLFLKMIEDGLSIPIFIELRKLSKKNTIIDEIISQLNGIDDKMSRELLVLLLKKGNFYFILDGFDEIALQDRDEVIEDIKKFINNLSQDNHFILTSRPETILSAFGEFKSFVILPLKEIEAHTLLKKYDDGGETSAKLIAELKTERNENVKEFLKNPLLVSLLFVVYNHKATIPLKKHLFYSQIYDALFEDHDLSKGAQNIHIKLSGLDKDDFEKILRYIGMLSFKTNSVQYSGEKILALIEDAKTFWPSLEVSPSEFLKDLTTAVPLFVKDGLEYKWSHKSLSEYFAAKFIYLDTKERQSEQLSKLYNSNNLPRYINLMDLYYDLDIIGFKKCILLPLFEAYDVYLSAYDKESMSYFLRNLCFLRNIRINVKSEESSSSTSYRIIDENEETFEYKIIIPVKKSKIIISISDSIPKNSLGKRLILQKLYEKKVHNAKMFFSTFPKIEWLSSLEKNVWHSFDSIIRQAKEESDKLGELCELITYFDKHYSVYLEKEDLESEIKLIKSELNAQKCDFLL